MTDRLASGAERARAAGRRPRVVIVGAGFGGLNAALGLGRLDVDVTVVDRRNHHLFQPLLYQVALAVLSPADIAQPIRTMLRRHTNTQVLMDDVTSIDREQQTVGLASGATLAWDYLILATGATHSYMGHDEWAQLAPGLKTVEDATEIRRRVLLAFELAERAAVERGQHPPLNFVVIGGGPTGVELAGAISDIAHLYMKHDFRRIDPARARVLLLQGGQRVLPAYPEELSVKALKALEKLGVEVRLGKHVTAMGPGWVEMEGERIEAAVTLWAAGVRANRLGAKLGTEVDRTGCVLVGDRLHPEGEPNVFIVGDLAHLEQDGKRIPGVAQPAMQMGRHVAAMIASDLRGAERSAFHYWDKGDMATIGRMAAVARMEWPVRARIDGLPAWLTWLVVHIFFLIGFRNRVSVFLAWMWSYFTFTRGARLITGECELPGWRDEG